MCYTQSIRYDIPVTVTVTVPVTVPVMTLTFLIALLGVWYAVSLDIITTIAGTGTAGSAGDGGSASIALLTAPYGVAVDASGNVYINDHGNCRIRKVAVSTGIISTIAGTGTVGSTGDGGPATSALLNYPHGIAVGATGNVYIADTYNQKIKKVTISTGIITAIAGTGSNGSSGDGGPATSAKLYNPWGVCVDVLGNIYIADYSNNKIRTVAISTGIISTIAGTGTTGSTGDGGPATSALLSYPWGVSVDASSNVYIADYENQKIRKVTVSTGIITIIAGTGTTGSTGDGGSATSALLKYPRSVALDVIGNVYIADSDNHRIRKVTVSTGIISTIAGTGSSGSSGDGGQATSALLNTPFSVSVDDTCNVYIADSLNQKIRKVTLNTSAGPSIVPTSIPSTAVPSVIPTSIPTTGMPSVIPTSITSTAIPSVIPTRIPSTAVPSVIPTSIPSTGMPSVIPTSIPSTGMPSVIPTSVPSTAIPSVIPTSIPSTAIPSVIPTSIPSAAIPSVIPTRIPSTGMPSVVPISIPSTGMPSVIPTWMPSTAVPSLQPLLPPTAQPSSYPTVLDLVDANLFTVGLTYAGAKAKIQYFLGLYVAFFAIMMTLLYVVHRSYMCNTAIDRMHASAYKSSLHMALRCTNDSVCSSIQYIAILQQRDVDLRGVDAMGSNYTHAEDGHIESIVSEGGSSSSSGTATKCRQTYSEVFHRYLVQQRCIIGCEPLLLPNGINSSLWGCKVLSLPTARVEDFILYLCNNEPLFGCICAAKGSRLGRNGRLIVYTMNNVTTFFLYSMSDAVFNYVHLPVSVSNAFSICLIAPASVVIVWVFSSLYTCICIDSSTFKSSSLYGYEDVCRIIGRLVLVPLSLVCFGLLVLSAILSRGHNQYATLGNYCVNVIVATIAQNILRAMLAFVSTFHIGVYVYYLPHRAVTMLNIGALYCESIHRSSDTMKEGIDYKYVCMSLLNIQIDVVIPMECAVVRLGIDRKKAVVTAVEGPQECISCTNTSNIVGDATTAATSGALLSRTLVDKHSVDIDYPSDGKGDGDIVYDDIYARSSVYSSIEHVGISGSDTIAKNMTSMNPLHITSEDVSVSTRPGSASHDRTSAVAAAVAVVVDADTLQHRIHTVTGSSKSSKQVLTRYARNMMQQQEVVQAYHVPDRIRHKRRSFVSAYVHIDTFVQSRKGTSAIEGTAASDVVVGGSSRDC